MGEQVQVGVMTTNSERRRMDVTAWVFYDGACPFCRSTLEWCRPIFEPRQFRFAPLQESWVRDQLSLSDGVLPTEMKLLTAQGRILGGIEAWAWMCRQVGWLWIFGVLLVLPGFRNIAHWAYHWVSQNRYCWQGSCTLPVRKTFEERHHTRLAFLEFP